ncbi:MAG: hypothetical protein HRT74_03820, partial [Flavobacteriales bacterium]|nr:hypothetical protein [Flavobacteriales bacterium]
TADGTSSPQSITTPDCSSETPGCTDATALNYNMSATIDDGTCEYPNTTVNLVIDTDCWGNEVGWTLTADADGSTIASVNSNTYGNLQQYTWTGDLLPGCYTFTITDSYGDGLNGTQFGCAADGNYVMTDDEGNILFEMGDPDYGTSATHNFCLTGTVPGCTDNTACNYDMSANTDNGSCEYTSCAGCTDSGACNYDVSATIDDSSCEYTSCAGCTDNNACNYDLSATIDDGTCEYVSSAGCTDSTACNYDDTAVIEDGSCDYASCAGCMDSGACNYDATATVDDGSCEYLSCAGCMDSTACNYDSTATIDRGSCDYDSCSCLGDMNSDLVVDVEDLLAFLSWFGCQGECEGDFNDDGAVNGGDMLTMLAAFGSDCQ